MASEDSRNRDGFRRFAVTSGCASKNGKTFSVDEADDPLLDTWPFLLIVRTGRIVTDHATSIPEGCDTAEYQPDTRVFQHIANCTRHLAMAVGNLCCTQRKP